jgi:hypothetical protein
LFVTSIFRDGRGFVPTTIFAPQLFGYHADTDNLAHLNDIQNKPNLIAENTDNHANTIQSLSDIRESACLEFQRLYKKDDETPTVSASDDYDDFKKTFDQLAQKRMRSQVEAEYNNFIAKREEKIRAEYGRLKKLNDYNTKLANKAMDAKVRDADKKRQKERSLEFLSGLLFGDKDDPSIPKPMLGILTAPHPGFTRLWHINSQRINPISAISPIIFNFGGGYYRTSPEISIKCSVKPKKHIVFSGIYRTWCNQFVKKIIEKRQRGPPFIRY